MTTEQETTQKGFIIYLDKLPANPTGRDVLKRIPVWRSLLNRAVKNGSRAYGLKLRKHGAIILEFPNGKQKVIRGLQHAETDRPVALWKLAVREMRKLLVALEKYCHFIGKIERCQRSPQRALPAEHPSLFFQRYIRNIFGDRYKQLHQELQKAERWDGVLENTFEETANAFANDSDDGQAVSSAE